MGVVIIEANKKNIVMQLTRLKPRWVVSGTGGMVIYRGTT